MTRRRWRRGVALVLGSIVFLAGPLRAADPQAADEDIIPASVRQNLDEMRRVTGCPVAPTDDIGRKVVVRGRQSIEIKGRDRDGDAPGTMRDLAVFDPAAARIVSFVCFTNASTRKSGEAIVSMAEVSSRGDQMARAIFPGSNLELESIKRDRKSGTESVYYEARYTSASGEFPFLEPPVRLLLNATTGSFFRLDIDPDWLDPAAPPRVRISRKAAERIAAVVLRDRDLAPAFGSGAVLGKVSAVDLFTVHPNDMRGIFPENAEAQARAAWVVSFRVDGGDAAGFHDIFIDAATGRILGGLLGQPAGQAPR